jgi:predicted secreted acid phosphatase
MKFLFIFFIIVIFLVLLSNQEKINFKDNEINIEEKMIPNLKLYKTAYNLGYDYINNYNISKNNAVMFDIDDTLLYVRENSNQLTLTPIKPMIELLNYCIVKGLTVVIITARDSIYQKQTINDLNQNHINYSFLYLRKNGEDNINTFKQSVKEYLHKNYGLKIIMSVGDQIIDIAGPYSGYGIKLPRKGEPKLYISPNGLELIEIKI